MRKLGLKKVTLRDLDDNLLSNVAGGGTGQPGCYTCYTYCAPCFSFAPTCIGQQGYTCVPTYCNGCTVTVLPGAC